MLSRARPGDAIIFAHGFLGSQYDMAHVCEALASDGFTCLAPEMPESVSGNLAGKSDALTREAIVNAVRTYGVDSLACRGRWGLFGHSLGAGTASRQPGEYALGRALLCGGVASYEDADPSFVIASDGDGCNALVSARTGLTLRAVLERDAAAGRPTTRFASAAEAYVGAVEGRADVPPPRRGAYVFDKTTMAGDGLASLPCHISFLWGAVNDKLASLLAPLLPLAKTLGLFVLDFDVYLESRDSETTARLVVPALRRFFLSF